MRKAILFAFLPLALAGCFTCHETGYPQTVLSKVAGDVRLAVEGFSATVTTYTPIYSTETMLVDGGPGPRHHRHYGPHYATRTVETLISNVQPTDYFVKRVVSKLESAGCILRANPVEYVVSGEFGGYFLPDGAGWKIAAVDLGSAFFALYDAAGYSLSVKLYDNSTGKQVFANDYVQEYSASGFSPLWIFGMACFEKIDGPYMRDWCYNVLVDRAMADVTAFLAQRQKP